MTIESEVSVVQLDELARGLPPETRSIFDRIFDVTASVGRLRPPDSMKPWIEKQFGSVDAVLEQKIVRVTNKVTLEGALFNWIRSSRPLWRDQRLELERELAEREDEDPLDRPYELTPEDVFGRIESKYCLTCANVAKFDGFHGLVIFKERHPLRFTREMIHDYIDTGLRWAQAAHKVDREAKYYLFIWNSLWRAGASLLHGHAQVMLGKHVHYALVEHQRRAALLYEAAYGVNYFDDLYKAHAALGCAFEKEGVRVIAYLTPVKENEVLIIAPKVNNSFKDRLYEVLACYRDVLGVTAFNLAIYQPPLAPAFEIWNGFPILVRLVDRGEPTARTSDIGAMELYATSVLSSDPFRLARTLAQSLAVPL